MNEHTRHFFRMTADERAQRVYIWCDGWFYSSADDAWISWHDLIGMARTNVAQRILRDW